MNAAFWIVAKKHCQSTVADPLLLDGVLLATLCSSLGVKRVRFGLLNSRATWLDKQRQACVVLSVPLAGKRRCFRVR